MALSENLVKEFADLMNDSTPVETEKSLYGTIKIVDEMSYVQLDGADEGTYTPIDSTVDVSDGDRVTVSIKRHSAVVTGNLTDPSAKTSVVGDINGKYSEISQSLDEIRSVIFGEDGSFSELKQTVNSFESRITDVEGNYSELKQTVDGFDITGLVKISDLKNGTTTITGNCIETGSIKFTALDSDAQDKVNGAYSAASNALSYAQNLYIPTLPSYLQSTYITSTEIVSPTIYGGQFYAMDANNSFMSMTAMGLQIYSYDAAEPKIQLLNNNNSIELIMGAGQDYGVANRLYLIKGNNYAQLYFRDNNGNDCGIQFNAGGTVTLIGTWP